MGNDEKKMEDELVKLDNELDKVSGVCSGWTMILTTAMRNPVFPTHFIRKMNVMPALTDTIIFML